MKFVYLMLGVYDLFVIIEEKLMFEVVFFVFEKFFMLDFVLFMMIYFIMKKYKYDGIIYD